MTREGNPNGLRLMAEHDDHVGVARHARGQTEYVVDDSAATRSVQYFGKYGPHPGATASCQYDDGST